MEILDKEIGVKLKKIREKLGLTIREVAEKIDVHYTYISKIENGQVPSLAKLNKLCELYGVKVSSLFGDEQALPDELKELGIKWITFAKEMDRQNLSPEDIKQIIKTLKILNKL